ncbi:MAG: hypothetical protein QNK23_18840 [Crocinitomicaceae bacterium]|nr:hypothetical protein [Crocinitomicaceae bacterium]
MNENDLLDTKEKRRLPDDNAILFRGYLCFVLIIGLVGFLLAVANIIHANKVINEYDRHPSFYLDKSIRKVRRGKKMSIAAMITLIAGLFILAVLQESGII